MFDWSVAANLATAAGTLILAVATFASVRSGARSARVAERALLANLRPLLVPTRFQDPPEKVGFMDDKWFVAQGGRAVAEIGDGVIYLVIPVRNEGNGIAVLDRWSLRPFRQTDQQTHDDPKDFRRLTRDLYVSPNDNGFWQGALRDPADPLFEPTREAIQSRGYLTIDLLYGDHEGGQRTISRFFLRPQGDTDWSVSVSRHWNLDRPDPR
jgi:hypothetical protein